MIEYLENIIAKVQCGDESKKTGTAFLISTSVAITAYHVVKDNPQKILLIFRSGEVINATIHEFIKEEHKAKDIALLVLEKTVDNISLIDFCCADVHAGDKWISRGFPAGKEDGENLFSNDNIVQQVYPDLKNGKYNIDLNHDKKFESYAGVSGAPLVISRTIVGVINSELNQTGKSIELKALSLNHFKDLIIGCNVKINEVYLSSTSLNEDTSGAELFDKTKPSDVRILKDKLQAVCKNISERRINKYSRDVATGIEETQRYNPQQIQAMKYRIFEVCQEVLLNFVEGRSENELSQQEIDNLLDSFTNKAEEIILDKSKDYHYPLTNRDILRKMILDLIDTCYLSFDEEGVYDE